MNRPTNLPSIFVDSSVFFTAARSAQGFARDLFRLTGDGQIVVIASSFVIQETRRNLSLKAPKVLPTFEELAAPDNIFVVNPSEELIRRVAEIVVTKDAPVVAGAMTAQADFLATFDRKHLLRQAAVIQEHFGVVVATPEEIVSAI